MGFTCSMLTKKTLGFNFNAKENIFQIYQILQFF